jgi:hypothetical protein
MAAIVSIVTAHPREPGRYKTQLRHLPELSHMTVKSPPLSSMSPGPAEGAELLFKGER